MKEDTSWQKVGSWYDRIVGEHGHYYHQHVILPNVLKLLELEQGSSLIDIACGQGVLARQIPQSVAYTGIDGAKELIAKAKSYKPPNNRTFLVGDVTKPWPISKDTLFSHAACILALQNMDAPEKVFEELSAHLAPKGNFVLVLNHPCFRIPRQSGWGFDEATKTQYRKVQRYMSAQKIPILAHPGSRGQETTWSFHQPISYYVTSLAKHGFVVNAIEEWCSDKVSTGKTKAWENRARKEFPLFLAIRAIRA